MLVAIGSGSLHEFLRALPVRTSFQPMIVWKEGNVENQCGGSNRLVIGARMGDAPLPIIPHHDTYLWDHLNKAVRESAKGARKRS